MLLLSRAHVRTREDPGLPPRVTYIAGAWSRSCHPQGSTRRLFAGSGADALRTAISKACKVAGVPLFSPHDLRHRRISLLHLQGMPWARIADFVGQKDLTVTANTYTHVLVERVSPMTRSASLQTRCRPRISPGQATRLRSRSDLRLDHSGLLSVAQRLAKLISVVVGGPTATPGGHGVAVSSSAPFVAPARCLLRGAARSSPCTSLRRSRPRRGHAPARQCSARRSRPLLAGNVPAGSSRRAPRS